MFSELIVLQELFEYIHVQFGYFGMLARCWRGKRLLHAFYFLVTGSSETCTFLDANSFSYSLQMYSNVMFLSYQQKNFGDCIYAKQIHKEEGFQYRVSLLCFSCLVVSRCYKVLKLKSETVNPYQEGSERREVKSWEDKDQNPDLIKRSSEFVTPEFCLNQRIRVVQ